MLKSKIKTAIVICNGYRGGALNVVEQHIQYLLKKNVNVIVFTDKNNFQNQTILKLKNFKIYNLNIFSPSHQG